MAFRSSTILLISDTLESACNLLKEMYEANSQDMLSTVQNCMRYKRIHFRDGTVVVAKGLSQPVTDFIGYDIEQVFSDVSQSTVDTEKLDHILACLHKSPIPPEFQWTYIN